MPLKSHMHERTPAPTPTPTLPQAVENSIVATSRTLTHASKCERINSKPRTFSAYSNFCSSYKLNCFCSFLNRLQLYVIYKKNIKDIFTKKKTRVHTEQNFLTQICYFLLVRLAPQFTIKINSSTANDFTLQLTVRKILN